MHAQHIHTHKLDEAKLEIAIRNSICESGTLLLPDAARWALLTAVNQY